jgi:hypothetical protein
MHAAFRVYGAERDALIARAKVVLNLHAHDNWGFETVRLSYLLANRKAVVCEAASPDDVDADLRDGLLSVPYDRLVEACVALAHDEPARRRMELRRRSMMSMGWGCSGGSPGNRTGTCHCEAAWPKQSRSRRAAGGSS